MRIQPAWQRQRGQKTATTHQRTVDTASTRQRAIQTEPTGQRANFLPPARIDTTVTDICAINVAGDICIIPGIETEVLFYYRAGYNYQFQFEIIDSTTPVHTFDPAYPYYTDGDYLTGTLTFTLPESTNTSELQARISMIHRASDRFSRVID